MATFNIQGSAVSKSTGAGIPFATVSAYQLGVAAPLASGPTDASGKFNLTFSWPHDVSIPANRPDVHFRITQRVDGADRIIYNENPATQTRRNIGDVLSVTLKAAEGVSTMPPPSTGRPTDSLFVFTRVGNTGVNQIDTSGPAASGYARADTSPAAPNSSDANAPFGSTLDLAGWFGQLTDVYRYKIQYSSDGVTWNDISDPVHHRPAGGVVHRPGHQRPPPGLLAHHPVRPQPGDSSSARWSGRLLHAHRRDTPLERRSVHGRVRGGDNLQALRHAGLRL
jgi:hypothetical protein